MAVSFVRAVRTLIAVHVRVATNSALRDAGLAVTVLAGVATVLIWLVITVPLVVLMFAVGYTLSADSAVVSPLVFSLAPLMGAFLAIMTGDGRALDWEKLKAYPVSPAVLFFAELLASLVHPASLLVLLGLAAMALGQVLGGTGTPGVMLVVWATSVGMLFALRAFVVTAAGWLVVRSQSFVVIGAMLFPAVLFTVAERADAGELNGLWASLKVGLGYLPAALQLRADWHTAAGAAQLFGPLLVPALVLAVTYALAFREAAPAAKRAQGPERLWSFRSPVVGLARLHLKAIVSSEMGRFTVVMPVLWVVPMLVVRAHLLKVVNGDALFVSVWAMTPTMLLNLMLNQFGPDRGAVKGLMLLPVGERELLRGKALGMGVIMLLNGLLVTPLAVVLARPSVATVLQGPLIGGTVFLVQLAIGQFASVLWPRPLPRKGLRQPPGGVMVGLVSMATMVGVLLPLLLCWWALHDQPVLATLVLGALCAGAFGVLLLTSRAAEQFLVARRERVVESLS